MNRISQQSLYNKVNFDLGRITEEMNTLNEQIASGKKVNRPSDDILGGATILDTRTTLAYIEQYSRDLSVAQEWLAVSESSLQGMKDALTEAKVLSEQMSTDTYRDSNLEDAAQNMDGIIQEIIQLANTRVAGRYIFAGSRSEASPFGTELTIKRPESQPGEASVYQGVATTSGTYTGSESKHYMVKITQAGGSQGERARLTTTLEGADDDLSFTAMADGAAGEEVAVEYVIPAAASSPLSVSVSAGGLVSVSLETDAAGNPVSTATQVLQALTTDPAASALVTANLAPGSDGSGVVSQAFGPVNLTRGATLAALENDFAALATGFGTADSNVRFTAVEPGQAGEAVRVRFVDPEAPNQNINVSVEGQEITIYLATDATGDISTTAAQLASAVNADADARALVTASLKNTLTGAGVVEAVGWQNLDTGIHDGLTYTARTRGAAGDNISITYLDPGLAGQPTSVNVVNLGGGAYDIQVSLATDATGQIMATAQEVAEAIAAHTPAAPGGLAAGDLVDVKYAEGSSASGIIQHVGTWNLANGYDEAAVFAVSEDGGATWVDGFVASEDGTAIYADADHTDLGVRLAFTNQGALTVGDTFTVDVTRYNGDDKTLEVNIEQMYRVGINITGTQALGEAGAEDNVLDCLTRIRDAMEDGDSLGVSAELPVLERILENMATNMSQAGVRLNRVDVGRSILETNKLAATDHLSSTEDLDFVDAITSLSLKQMAYQASLASTSLITKLSLLDYIG